MLLKLALGTLPASIRALKPISVVMKPLTSFIMICAALQLVSTYRGRARARGRGRAKARVRARLLLRVVHAGGGPGALGLAR